MTSPLEMRVQRAQTLKFINSDPSLIALIPVLKTKNASGGFTRTDQPPRAVQTFKLIPQTETNRPTVTVDGVERAADYVLLGLWDAVVAYDDHWTDGDGFSYAVLSVSRNEYESKALVVRRG